MWVLDTIYLPLQIAPPSALNTKLQSPFITVENTVWTAYITNRNRMC